MWVKVHRGFKSHRHRQGVVTKLPRLKLRNLPQETGSGSWRGVSLRSAAVVVLLAAGWAGALAGAGSFGYFGQRWAPASAKADELLGRCVRV